MIRPSILLLVLPLAACAGQSHRYPSLARRAVEGRGFDEPVRTPAVVTPDPTLDADLARQGAQLDRIASGFAEAAGDAQRRVERAAHQPAGSDPWLDAQAALASLDGWRSQASALTATLEEAGSARAARLAAPYPALDALAARAAAEVERETSTIERLQQRVPAA